MEIRTGGPDNHEEQVSWFVLAVTILFKTIIRHGRRWHSRYVKFYIFLLLLF